MKYLLAISIALLMPTVALAKGECKEERNKFCAELKKADLLTCLKKHEAELSSPCKAKLEARENKPAEKDNAGTTPTTSTQPQPVCFDESCKQN
jgi:hypothetical protein